MESKDTSYFEQVITATKFIKDHTDQVPEIGMVLGSGLGELVHEMENPILFPFHKIPFFPTPTVKGHSGQLVIGQLKGKTVIVLQGRVHFYEGYSMQEITFPIRVMQMLGIHSIIVTNSCGGVRKGMDVGSLYMITDHINLMGANPLIGKNIEQWGTRFPDMLHAYDPKYIELGKTISRELKIQIYNGIFAAVSGPNYETPAELKYLETIGVDLIGMSSVPEAIVARHAGIRVLGISCVTDVPLNDPSEIITHEDVIKIAKQSQPNFKKLMLGIIERM